VLGTSRFEQLFSAKSPEFRSPPARRHRYQDTAHPADHHRTGWPHSTCEHTGLELSESRATCRKDRCNRSHSAAIGIRGRQLPDGMAKRHSDRVQGSR
jgi:hypothetical protein